MSDRPVLDTHSNILHPLLMRGYGQALTFVSMSVYQNGFCVLVSAEREVMGHDCTCEYCHETATGS